jgi:hypothetical protein
MQVQARVDSRSGEGRLADAPDDSLCVDEKGLSTGCETEKVSGHLVRLPRLILGIGQDGVLEVVGISKRRLS